MLFIETTATRKINQLTKRVRGVAGGTGASKTISIALLWIDKYQTLPNRVGSIVSESVPHLRRGVMRDFFNILKAHGYYKEENHNKTDSIYKFETGSYIEFFAADMADKLRGGRRDDLWINEANNVGVNAFNELEIRTRDTIWLDWNPTTSFWFYEDLLINRDDVDHITLTYKDNEALEPSIVRSIEARKYTNPSWYKVYGLGELGSLEGLIYNNWEIIDEVPEDARLERRGLDFGYTNDPSALVGIYRWNDGFILDEEMYATGMSNKNIADMILAQPEEALVVADSAEPKSIDEIKSYNIQIIGSVKGSGSVNQGIQLIQDQKLYITKQSLNLIKAFRNYQWKTDKLDKPLNIAEHEFSHGPDAVRYGLADLLSARLVTIDDIAL